MSCIETRSKNPWRGVNFQRLSNENNTRQLTTKANGSIHDRNRYCQKTRNSEVKDALKEMKTERAIDTILRK